MTKKKNGIRKGRGSGAGSGSESVKPKITKEERRAKYTQIARDRRDKQFQRERSRHTVCYKCREKGHTSAQCGKTDNNNNTNLIDDGVLCYKCGSTEHSLKECKQYKGKGDSNLPHATCYICHAKGHLASACQQNKKGIYVNGGACRTCGSTQHVSLSCPERQQENKKAAKGDMSVPDESFDDLLETSEPSPKQSSITTATEVLKKKKKKVVKF